MRIRRALAPAPNGEFWSASEFFEYELTLWDSLGSAVRSFTREPDWYPTYDSVRSPAPDAPPSPAITGLLLDTDGRLWILGRAAAPEWKSGLGNPQTIEGQLVYQVGDWSKVYEGVIEVLDASDGSLISSLHLVDQHYLLPISAGIVAAIRESRDGWILIDVYGVELAADAI